MFSFSLIKDTVNLFWLRLFGSELESSTYPSVFRVRLLGYGFMLMNVVFGLAMRYLDKQPYEPLWVRITMIVLAALLVLHSYRPIIHRISLPVFFSFVTWVEIPLFASWMYMMNSYSPIWLSCLGISIVLYFLIHSWRQALLGVLVAWALAGILTFLLKGQIAPLQTSQLLLIVFAISLSLVHSMTMSNQREQRFRQSLSIIGLIQNSVTPSIHAIQALLPHLAKASQDVGQAASAQRLQILSRRFEESLQSMEQHIHLQRTNAQLLGLYAKQELISAEFLVRDVVSNYAYSSAKLKRCVSIDVISDFAFMGNREQWVHALGNMMSNALESITRSKLHLEPGDLTIHIQGRSYWGRISFHDRGEGIERRLLPHVFEPFFSAGPMAGIGLGLTYCKHIAISSGGRVAVSSDIATGTVFHIYLPVAKALKH